MSVRSIDHVYVETHSFDQALAFWRDLGFEVERSWGGEGHRACQLRSTRAQVVLAEAVPGAEAQGPTTHLAVTEPERLQEQLTAADNARVVTPLSPTHWGTHWIRVEDPDGNLWVLETPATD